MNNKPCISLVFAGQVDSGKSTMLGHLLYQVGGVPEREIEKYKRESLAMGKSSFCFAWVIDQSRAERERGITVHGQVKSFEGPTSQITVWDAPGHRDFIKNTLSCIVQSDVMVLCVSAVEGEFNASISPDYGTLKSLLISSLSLGIKQIIVAINKMDIVKYSEDRFKAVENKMGDMMKKTGWKSENYSFVPVSGWNGDNLTQPSDKMPWWKGPTLAQAIFDLPIPERLNNHPLRFVVDDSHKISGIGTVLTGKVSSGVLRPAQKLTFGAYNINPVTVFSIERHHNQLPEASSGMNVGINVKGAGIYASQFKRGMVGGDETNYPPKACKKFTAEIYILNHPGTLKVGYTPIIDCGTAHVACRMSSILCLLAKDKTILEDSPKGIKKGNFARVVFEPTKPMVVEDFAQFPDVLSRLLIRDGPKVIGVGKVIGTDSEQKSVGMLTKAAVRKD